MNKNTTGEPKYFDDQFNPVHTNSSTTIAGYPYYWNSGDFIEWLRGFAAALGDNPPNSEQWKKILEKIGLSYPMTSWTYVAPNWTITPNITNPYTITCKKD